MAIRIPAPPGRMAAIAIPARPIILITKTIVILTTTIVLGLKRLGHSYIDILLLLSFPT